MSFIRSLFHANNVSKRLVLSRTIQRNYVQLKPTLAPPEEVKEPFQKKNLRLQRPLSPHLSIYKVQLTSALSLIHRATGIAAVSYVVLFALFPVTSLSPEVIISFVQKADLAPELITAAKFILTIPITYHTANGVRHLIWDSGKALSIKGVYVTGYSILAATIILSTILTCL